jgi:adenine-specific DNA methylase
VPVLVARLCDDHVHFDQPTASEREAAVEAPQARPPLEETIPDGLETGILRRAGFTRWLDVMPPRQLLTLLAAADVVDTLDVSEPVRARLRLALCGAVEMAGYLSRWDRYYPKAFEAMANHRFPALGLACETNLLGGRGRGTIPRRFAASVAAARWSSEHLDVPHAARMRNAAHRRGRLGAGPLVVCGSSERQLPAAETVDLVITDPPYFDDVQYAELASLLLAWARALGVVPATVELDLRAEAVVNHTRGSGAEEYRSLLTRVFTETARTLKADGRVLITFHNTDIRAWWALASALASASLGVVATAVSEAENATDHPKRNRRSFTKDLVLECARTPVSAAPVREVGTAGDQQALELQAIGRVIATCGSLPLETFAQRFLAERGGIEQPRIQTPTPTPQ